MPSQAYSAYGTEVRVGDGTPLTALTITGASNTAPIIVTTATAHGVIDVSYGVVTGITGNTAANGSWVLERTSATQLKLRGSVGNAVYVSGGTITLQSTFAPIAELRDVQDAGSRATLIDVSAHDGNQYSSMIPTLKATNAMRLDVNLVPDDPSHDITTGLLALFNSLTPRHWLLVLPPYPGSLVKSVAHLYGRVDYYTMNLPVDGAVQAQFTLAFDGAVDWQPA